METAFNPVKQPGQNTISQLWSRYFPYWPVFLVLLTLAAGGAWLYLKQSVPVYKSTATLLIKDERKGIEDSKVMESMDLLSSKKIIENEMEVIKSRALMSQVVLQLKLYAPIFQQAKWRDVSLYTNAPVILEVQQPEDLAEVQKINFTYNKEKRVVSIAGRNYPLQQWVSSPWGTIRFSATNKASDSNVPYYFSLIHPKRVIQNLLNRLTVTSINKLASVISLEIKDEVPGRSEDILNTLIADYSKTSLNDKNSLAKNTLSFLDERLKSVADDLSSIEKQLQKYKANKGAIDITSQGKLFLQNVSDNDQKLSDVNMKLAVLVQVEQYVTSHDTRGGLVPSTFGIDDPLLTNLLNKMYETELQYEKLKGTTGENNPQLASLTDQIEKLKPSILENVQNQQQSLQVTKKNLFSTNNSYTSLLQGLPQQERDIVEISREQNIKGAIYSLLLQKREETALSYSSTVSDSRIMDKAEYSLDPVGPGKTLIYGLAMLVALGLSIALVTAWEMFNHTILFRQEIEAISSFPVIGEIVYQQSKDPIVLHGGNTTFIAEQIRMLRASLSYLGIGSKGKKIMVTSTISGEGKSFVAANLGLSLSMAGKKVVLVEFDLSNPTLANKFVIDGGKGVSDFLSEDIKPEEVIRKTNEHANLFLIAAGKLPPNPSDLILSARSAYLLEYLENNFDYILVDTAPVGLLSDGYILSKLCDATLYIVRHRHTPKKRLERLIHNNRINELKNMAIVFNGVQSRGFGRNKYGYGYGYGYVYNETNKYERATK